MVDGYTELERPRKRRGRRLLTALLVLLILLAVLVAVADRAGAAYAERRVAEQVVAQLSSRGITAAPPDVTVSGVPFLTQVLRGSYELITVRLRDLASTNAGTLPKGVQVQRLDVDARDVVAPVDALRTGQGDIVARTVEGAALIDYANVAKMTDQPGVKLTERNGQLAVTAPLEILGQKLTVNGTAELKVVKGAVQVRFRELTAEGLPALPAAQDLVTAYAQQMAIDVPIGQLPFGLVVQDVKAQADGLALTATAQNVPLNGAGR